MPPEPPHPNRLEKWAPIIKAALLLAGACMLSYDAAKLYESYDERAHLNAGLEWLHRGTITFDPANMTLRALLALPAWVAGAPLPASMNAPWPAGHERDYMVMGRFVQIAIFTAFAATLGFWAGRRISPLAGIVATALMMFEPTMAAFGCLAGTDTLIMAACGWLTLAAYEWMRKPSWPRAALLGIALGAALLAKLSSVLWCIGLALGVAIWTLANFYQDPARNAPAHRRAQMHSAAQILAAGVAAWLMLGCFLGFNGVGTPLRDLELKDPLLRALAKMAGPLLSPLPYAFVHGFDELHAKNVGRVAYFAGEMRVGRGFCWDHPVLLVAKPPLAMLALWLMAIVAFVLRRRAVNWPVFVFFAAPVVVFLYCSCISPLQIGVRYLSPVFPVLALGAAWGAQAMDSRAWRRLSAALCAWIVILSIHIAPHHLAWFNPILGGPEHAWRWYSDSNQDWGQTTGEIHKWIAGKDKPVTFFPIEGETTGWVALSTNMLVGLDPGEHARKRWLREDFEPNAFVPPYWHVYKIPQEYWKNHAVKKP